MLVRAANVGTAPPRSAHVQLGDVPRTHDLVELRGRVPSARWRDDGVDEATDVGLRLSTAYDMTEVDYDGGGRRTRLKINDQLVCSRVPPCPYI